VSPPLEYNSDDDENGSEPEYQEYTDQLGNAVMRIAEQQPDRVDVWPLLLACGSYSGESSFTRWLATHADKTSDYFVAMANNRAATTRAADALIMIAQIIACERDMKTLHRLGSSRVDELDKLVQENLSDSSALIRSQAMTALGIMGGPNDVHLLETIATTDNVYDSDHGFYPYRVNAASAAERLRQRLSPIDSKR